ncbi:MAG: NADH-quinone oxidoreductase subunit J [Bdellovibrionota bacterium]|nr:MAG: NADH-quinone oxidoreductase subunit J [Bdellovibrionota bacterium]
MMILFALLGALVIASAIGVVALRHPIHSALCLVLNLVGVAALYAMLDAHFLSAVQIIVYAGAIMVLVLFVIMLLNIKVEQPHRRGIILTLLATLAGVCFLGILAPLFYRGLRGFTDHSSKIEGTVEAFGELLFTRYLFPFEAASVLIMVAIVGAVMIGKRHQQGGSK